MTDREKMIEVILEHGKESWSIPMEWSEANALANRLIEAGFGRVNVSFKKFREDVLYHGFHERWDDVKQLVRKELE